MHFLRHLIVIFTFSDVYNIYIYIWVRNNIKLVWFTNAKQSDKIEMAQSCNPCSSFKQNVFFAVIRSDSILRKDERDFGPIIQKQVKYDF